MMFEEVIEVRDSINLDELTKKEFSLVIDYNLPLEEIIERSGNFFKKPKINHLVFPVPSTRKRQKVEIILKIFVGIYHRDILAKMENEGFFGANIYEGVYFSKYFPKIQYEIQFFTPGSRKPGSLKDEVFSPCFSTNSFGEKTIFLDVINFNDKTKNGTKEKIYLLGVKIIRVIS